jgi:hypothetical protein
MRSGRAALVAPHAIGRRDATLKDGGMGGPHNVEERPKEIRGWPGARRITPAGVPC